MEENLLQKDIQTRIKRLKIKLKQIYVLLSSMLFGIERNIKFPYPMLMDLMKIKFLLRQDQYK